MQFKFDWNSSLDKEEVEFLTPGVGTFKIVGVYDRDKKGTPMVTSKGDPKIRVDVMVTDATKSSKKIYEHISSKMGWRLGHLFAAIGKKSLYTPAGVVDPRHLVGGEGECIIGLKPDYNNVQRTVVDSYVPANTDSPINELPDDPLDSVGSTAAGFGDDKDDDADLPF